MKKFVLFVCFLIVVFGGSFVAVRFVDGKVLSKAETKSQVGRPSGLTLKNLSFVVVVVGVNNGAGLERMLSSVFSQNYENYRVIYVDDASDDGSFDLARDLIYDSGHLGRVTLVRNEERLGVLANLFRAVQFLEAGEIVVVLQGEDWLAHEWVLQRLNAYYADPDVWITYGQYRDFPSYQIGLCREFVSRGQPFAASHLKTFYAALFKRVREADFISAGKFLPACSEMAYMVPMLEMARGHAQFIPEVLYIANRQTSYKEDRETQMRCEKFIRALEPYLPLSHLFEVEKCGG